jgi:hypothetical protein
MRCYRTDDELAIATVRAKALSITTGFTTDTTIGKKRSRECGIWKNSRADWRVHFMPELATCRVWF